MSFLCPTCNAGMYCLDSRSVVLGDKVRLGTGEYSSKVGQSTERRYGCPNCHRRYFSTEVLYSKHYTRKPIPDSHFNKKEPLK